MSSEKNVRLGVIGLGIMGVTHLEQIMARQVAPVQVAAICDGDAKVLAKYPMLTGFTDSKAIIRSGLVDAVLVFTPHYSHTDIGIDALANGLHVLMEKPISVHKADCEKLIAAYKSAKN